MAEPEVRATTTTAAACSASTRTRSTKSSRRPAGHPRSNGRASTASAPASSSSRRRSRSSSVSTARARGGGRPSGAGRTSPRRPAARPRRPPRARVRGRAGGRGARRRSCRWSRRCGPRSGGPRRASARSALADDRAPVFRGRDPDPVSPRLIHMRGLGVLVFLVALAACGGQGEDVTTSDADESRAAPASELTITFAPGRTHLGRDLDTDLRSAGRHPPDPEGGLPRARAARAGPVRTGADRHALHAGVRRPGDRVDLGHLAGRQHPGVVSAHRRLRDRPMESASRPCSGPATSRRRRSWDRRLSAAGSDPEGVLTIDRARNSRGVHLRGHRALARCDAPNREAVADAVAR